MAAVLEAAMRVQRFLAAAGVDCGCDTTVPMSPGQKFKHWCALLPAQGLRDTLVVSSPLVVTSRIHIWSWPQG